jgi:tetratricopeptide (TPR) repeat protein
MKKYIGFLIVLLVSSTLTGCFDLEQQNPNQQDETSFWTNEDNLEKGVYACYDMMQKFWGDKLPNFAEGYSDEGTSIVIGNEYYDQFRFTGIDVNILSDTYSFMYNLIGRAFNVIYYAPGIQGPKVANLTAQARFFVALGYYEIVLFFGENMPYVDEMQTPKDLPLQAKDGELYKLMEDNLIQSIPDLPLASDLSSGDYGLVTKGAAQSLLAKVYMQQHKYTEAEEILSEVINSNEYQLNDDFAVNFDGTNDINPEAVFIVNFVTKGPEGPGSNDYNIRPTAFSLTEAAGTWGDIQARPFILDEFNKELDKEGNPDPRMDETVWYKDSPKTYYGKNWAFWTEGIQDSTVIAFYKYSDQESVNSMGGGVMKPGLAGTDFILIRYADILLLYAEALNKNHKTSDAYTYVNRVRARSNMNDLTPGLNEEDFHTQLKHERLVELFGEQIRLDDLKRWGDYNATIAVNDPDFSTFVTGKSERAPIPQRELDLNKNLRQNPGW